MVHHNICEEFQNKQKIKQTVPMQNLDLFTIHVTTYI